MTRKLWPTLLALLLIFSLAPVVPAQGAGEAQSKPNIVYILVDNLGWGELGVYGGGILRGAPTPRLDQFASEGLRLLNFNVETECVPTRTALMTGRHPVRTGTYKTPAPGQPNGLVRWEVTIAKLLSAQGYATALYGKWHLGDKDGRLPNDQGFDEWYGIPRTTDESLFRTSVGYDPKNRSSRIHSGRKSRRKVSSSQGIRH